MIEYSLTRMFVGEKGAERQTCAGGVDAKSRWLRYVLLLLLLLLSFRSTQ